MDRYTKLAAIAIICLFILNAVITTQFMEREKEIRALEKDLKLLRSEIKIDKGARASWDESAAAVQTQKDSDAQKKMSNIVVRMDRVEMELARMTREFTYLKKQSSNLEQSQEMLLEMALPDSAGKYDAKQLEKYLKDARALFESTKGEPWKHREKYSAFETHLARDLLRYKARPQLLPLDDVEHLISSYVRLKLHYFQQLPQHSCHIAPLLGCKVGKSCGFGCELHHLADCLIVAHKTGRQMVVDVRDWTYNNPPDDLHPHSTHSGWQYFFKPLSTCSLDGPADSLPNFSDQQELREDPTRVLSLPIIDGRQEGKWAIYYVPQELKDIVSLFHPDPPLWYLAQLITYLMRLNNETARYIAATRERLQLSQPFLGMHIRRTDKLQSEAQFHHVQDYITRALQILKSRDQIHGNGAVVPPQEGLLLREKRDIDREIGIDWPWHNLQPSEQNFTTPNNTIVQVYVATDDEKECGTMASKYGTFDMVCNEQSTKQANAHRFSRVSMLGLLSDIFLLAESEVFVGTFSSQVSRVVYELAQTVWRPAGDRIKFASSLDDGWYFSG